MANEWEKRAMKKETESRKKVKENQDEEVIKIPSNNLLFSGISKSGKTVECYFVRYDFVIVWHSIKEPKRNWADINLAVQCCCCYFLLHCCLFTHTRITCFVQYECHSKNSYSLEWRHKENERSSRTKNYTSTVYTQKEDNTRWECFSNVNTPEKEKGELCWRATFVLIFRCVGWALLCRNKLFSIVALVFFTLTWKYPCERKPSYLNHICYTLTALRMIIIIQWKMMANDNSHLQKECQIILCIVLDRLVHTHCHCTTITLNLTHKNLA